MWHKVVYTDKLIFKRFNAMTIGFLVLIRPKFKDDVGIHKHELIHVGRFWKNPLLHWAFYSFSQKVRLAEEVEAYKEQLKWPPATRDPIRFKEAYAGFISDKYRLKVTKNEVYELL